MSLAKKLLAVQPAAGGGGPFNPETDITWHSLFWAEGTDFVAQGYSDTDGVTTWPNETGEVDMAGSGVDQTYDASDTVLNNQPSVQFSGTAGIGMEGAFTTAPDYTSGMSVVTVARTTATDAIYGYWSDADSHASGSLQQRANGSGRWTIWAGVTSLSGGQPTVGAHLLTAFMSGSAVVNSRLDVDGTNVLDGDAGSNQITKFRLGTLHGDDRHLQGAIAFVGVYEGDITTDGSFADLETWVEDHYGITIA